MEKVAESDSSTVALQHRPEIDSLRAIAIVPVVLFHLYPPVLPSGYLGVDVFFVISGYLITRIQLHEMDRGIFRLQNFYARRIRRLAPVILCVVAVTLIVAKLGLTSVQRVYVGQQSVMALIFLSNFFFLRSAGDYWGPTAETTVLLHAWSLSVEEQFYLLYPIFLLFLKAMLTRWITAALVAVIVVSGLAYLIVIAVDPSAAFYLLPTRAWELASGGLIASLERSVGNANAAAPSRPKSRSRPLGDWGHFVGLLLIMLAYVLSVDYLGNEANAALAVVGTMLFLGDPSDRMRLKYTAPLPLVYLGRISFSWYMWHWPIIVLNQLLGVHAQMRWVAAGGLLAAICSYHVIEQPTRRRKGIIPWIGVVFVFVFAYAVYSALPTSIRKVDPALYNRVEWYGMYYNADTTEETSDWHLSIVRNVHAPASVAEPNAYQTQGILFGSDREPEIVLLGDSHATMWARTIHEIATKHGRSLCVWALNGYDPLFDDAAVVRDPDSIKSQYDQMRQQKLKAWHPRLIIVSVRWAYQDLSRARAFIEFVKSNSDNVLILGTTPELTIGDQNAREYLMEIGVIPQPERRVFLPRAMGEGLAGATKLIRDIAASSSNVHYLPLDAVYERGAETLVLDGKDCVYLDDDHLSQFGAALALPLIEREIERLSTSEN